MDQLSKSIYRTSVYQDTMKETKHSRDQIDLRLVNRLVRFNKEAVSPYGLEDWEVSDQEEMEGNESSDDNDDQTCTEVKKKIRFLR